MACRSWSRSAATPTSTHWISICPDQGCVSRIRKPLSRQDLKNYPEVTSNPWCIVHQSWRLSSSRREVKFMRISVRVIDKNGRAMILHLVDWDWYATPGFLPAHQGLCVRLSGDLICYVNNQAGAVPLLTLREFEM